MRYFVTVALLAIVGPLFAQENSGVNLTNTRTVKGQTLKSTGLPKLKLKFAKDFKYAGGHTFILYDVARAEQHFFVDADDNGNISRLYWVQFEGYLPTNSHSYDYKSPKTVDIGGLSFYADAGARKVDPKQGRPDSDGHRANNFLLAKGFRLASDEVISQRLVHLIDKEKRSELMIIYLEVLTPFKMTSADLGPDGKDREKWPAMADALLERAKSGMKIIR